VAKTEVNVSAVIDAGSLNRYQIGVFFLCGLFLIMDGFDVQSMGYRFVSYVHSSNDVYEKGSVGENCFILERQTTNYDCAIGDNVVMWSGCHIGDGSRIGDNCFLGSHVVVNGFVEVGAGSYLSSNCTLVHHVKIGARSFIGANALIASDTAEGAVHVIEPTQAIGMDSMRFLKLLRHDI